MLSMRSLVGFGLVVCVAGSPAGASRELVPGTTLPTGMVGWWRAEGNGNDSVGTNHGVFPYGVAFGPGAVGQSFDFDGSHRRVSIPDHPDFSLTNSLTLECWIYPRRWGGFILFRGDNRSGLDPWQLDVDEPGFVRFLLINAANQTAAVLAPVQLHQWQHVAGTLDGETGDVKLYVNGDLAAQINTPIRPFAELDPRFEPAVGIGNHGGTFHLFPFDGRIDEVAIYARALGAAEIAGRASLDALPPTVTVAPRQQAVAVGGTAEFIATVSGTPPLTYQWRFEGGEIPGATRSALVLSNVQPAQAGNYAVTVSNAWGVATSSNATLTVLTMPPSFSVHPTNTTVRIGQTAVLVARALGLPAPTYQWFFNGSPMSGQTTTALTLTNVQPVQAGTYWAVASNLFGVATSSNAILTVLPPPVCLPPPSGLVAWWRGESNSWDSIGVNDARGLRILPREDLAYTNGKVGAAFQSLQQYYTVPASGELDVGKGEGLTVECWIKPAAVSGLEPLVEWTSGAGIVGVALQLGQAVKFDTVFPVLEARFLVTNAPLPLTVWLRSPPGATHLSTQAWNHVALTFDKPSGLAALYVNGVVVAQTSLGALRPQTQFPLFFGCRPSGFPSPRFQYFRGSMDEISLYNRALTAAEIQAIVAADDAGKCAPPLACVSPPSDFVAWWRGESNALDHVDANHGVITQAVSFTNGMVGRCFQLTTGFVRIPASSNLDVGLGPGLTIEGWFNPHDSRPQPLLEWNSGTGMQGVSLIWGVASPWLEANLVDTSGVSRIIRSPAGLFTNRVWQHVALTYDKAAGIATLYLNGNPVAQTNLGTFTPRTSQHLYFGYRPPGPYTGSGLRFTGGLDEVSLYARALTAAEIRAIIKARSAGKCTEPPTIVSQPASLRVNAGADAHFSVVATGNPLLHYQWRFNGTNIPGATAASLTLTNVQDANAGFYSVRVTNWFGSVVSSDARLRVNHPPVADASATTPRLIVPPSCPPIVVLDGSRSADPDADPLQYFWFRTGETNLLATGVVAVVTLPWGTHSLTLVVDDGLATGTHTFTVEILTPAQAVERLIAQVNARVSRPRPLVATLEAARAAIARGNGTAAVNELAAFQNKVRAQVAPDAAPWAAQLIQAAQEIMDALNRDCTAGLLRPKMGKVQRADNGRLRMEFAAPAGRVWVIEASTNLVDWERIGVAREAAPGEFVFEDAHAAQNPVRFYRIVFP